MSTKKGIVERFFDWFAEPFIDTQDDTLDNDELLYDGTKIIKKSYKEIKSSLYRPNNFDEYIGQERAKVILNGYIKAIKERNKIFPHILIYGKAGCGKTTLAKIIAKSMGVNFVETITSDVKEYISLRSKIGETKGGILFLDEIHGLERELAETIYSMMEDFTYNGNLIPEFTLIGATTEVGEIIKKTRPFYDRFKLMIELEDYTISELSKITEQYKNRTFPHDVIQNNVYDIIGKNCRGTPRTAIRLIEATVYLNGNISLVLNNFNIIKDGYTLKDLKALKYISQNDRGVGLQGLAAYLDTATETYLYEIEPYLLTNNLILRSPRGRKITEQGLLKIIELQKEI